jgi:hypothetical protein
MNGLIELPKKVDEWTLDTVVAIVRKYEFEPGTFDYKEVLNATNPRYRKEHNASISRTACAMANADGGFILFGVRDRNLTVSSPEDRIVGIPLEDDLRKVFSDKLSTVQRPIYFEASQKPLVLSADSTRGIFVVYIPQSLLRPHMDESTGNFYRRGEGGKADIMKFYEVREQMMYTEERLRKVTLFRLKLARYLKMAHEMEITTSPVTEIYYRFDTGAFDILLADICGLLPPSTDLLEQLLEIPIMANVVNEFLARTTLSYFPNNISSNFTDIMNKGNDCENELNQLFGSLPGNNQ